MADFAWKPVEIKHLNDPDGIDWKIQHRSVNIRYDEYEDTINIKIARDSKAERIYSAAYMRKADMKDDGIYDVSLLNIFSFVVLQIKTITSFSHKTYPIDLLINSLLYIAYEFLYKFSATVKNWH
jgi:hypothetical protein